MIQADTASNALIITASEPVYNNLRSVIEKLDVRRPQVFVEALIVEVTADKAAEFGVQWQNLNGATRVVATSSAAPTSAQPTTSSVLQPTSVRSGKALNIGIVNGTTTLPGVGTVLNLGMLAHALETDTNANILSAPNLMTLDNEEAKIVVGQNVPFITGQYAQTGPTTTATPFQTIERKDVGLTLEDQAADFRRRHGAIAGVSGSVERGRCRPPPRRASSPTNAPSNPTSWWMRPDRGARRIDPGSVNDVASKIPLLGDIPLLGELFRYETRQRTKTNLMVFIRPYIMHQADGYQKITDDRYDQMRRKTRGELVRLITGYCRTTTRTSSATQAGHQSPCRCRQRTCRSDHSRSPSQP